MKNFFVATSRLMLVIGLCLIGVTKLSAQLPAPNCYNQWAFGFNVGTDVVAPVNNFNTAIFTDEGTGTFCDANGNLMFYTDSRKLWYMPGNVLVPFTMQGSPNNTNGSATQGVVILPWTGHANHFLIFVVSDSQSPTPYNFGLTVYDYDAVAHILGLAANQPVINSYCTEGITAIPDCNGRDYWVIVKPIINPNPAVIHAGNNATFVPNDDPNATNNCLYAYHVDINGCAPNPVLSNFTSPLAYSPTLNGGPTANWVNTLKASPDRHFLALGERVNITAGRLNLYRFDCGSGTFDFIFSQPQPSIAYGVSFSPNSLRVYTSNGPTQIRQYDLALVDSELHCHGTVDTLAYCDIPIIHGNSSYQLQLTAPGPNQEILIAQNGATNLDEIRFPDNPCNAGYSNNTFLLGNGVSSRAGLPNNVDALRPGSLVPMALTVCPDTCTDTICFEASGCAPYYSWDFGDGTQMTGTGYSPVSNVPGTSGTYIDPCHVYTVAGTYTVTVWSINGQAQVVVNVPQGWNETTTNSVGGDRGNDILTDANGNVYVCGTFSASTQFPTTSQCGNITITGGGGPNTSAYIAKYDPCGNLLWVNFENGPAANSTGTGLAMDEQRHSVYMTGICNGPAGLRFQSVASAPCVTPVAAGPFPSAGIYVARFDMTTGAYLDVYTYTPPQLQTMQTQVFIDAHHLSPITTDVFVTGTYLNSANSDMIFVQRVNNTNTTYAATWTKFTLPQPINVGRRKVWDISYSITFNRVYITGEFKAKLRFATGVPVLSTSSTSDAFVWAFNAANGSNIAANKLGVTGSASHGTGLSVFATVNGVYATGYYDVNVINPFGLSATTFTGPANYRSYVMLLNPGSLIANQGQNVYSSAGGSVQATGISISFTTGQALITGRLTGGNITNPAFTSNNGNFVSFTSTAPKMFVAGFDFTNNLNPLWVNAAKDAVANSSHLSGRIVGDTKYCYSTGGYTNQFDYNYSITVPFSGPLVASPSGTSNSYFVRNDMINNGSFRMMDPNQETISEEEIKVDEGLLVKIYPNPSNGTFTIEANADMNNTQLDILDLVGNMVYSRQFGQMQTEQVDISSLSNGVYFVHLHTGDGRTETHKIIKQ